MKNIPTEYSKILSDWKKAFPMLSPYTQRRLYLRSDIFMFGLRFERRKLYDNFMDSYELVLDCYALWDLEETGKHSLISGFRVGGAKEFGVFLYTYLHYCEFEKYKNYVSEKFASVFKEQIKLSDFYNVIKNNIFKDYTSLPKLYSFAIFNYALGYYTGKQYLIDLADEIFEVKLRESWFLDNFRMTIAQWKDEYIKSLETGEFVEQVRINSLNPKIAKLHKVIFIDDLEPPRLSAWEKMMRILRKY